MARIILLRALIFFLSVAISKSVICPSPETLNPCICKRVAAYGFQVVCGGFKSAADLKRVLNILRNYRVHTFVLRNSIIEETLPSTLFNGLKIKEIKIERSTLKFDQSAFTELDTSLNILDIAENSMIKSNDNFSLTKFTNLNELSVHSNNIQMVSDTWLNEKVPNVYKVVLEDNRISEIQEHAFAHLSQLKYISLHNNNIKIMKRSMFPNPALHLAEIDLSNNAISSLPSDFFEGMLNLKKIILSCNDLKSLPEATWSPVWGQLTKVYLIDNSLVCNQEMNWIKKMRQPYELEGDCVLPKSVYGKRLSHFYNIIQAF